MYVPWTQYNMRPTGLANNEHISSNRGWLDEMIAVKISFHELLFSQEVLVIRIIILLLESPCSSVRWSVTEKYRIIDICTIHTCNLQDQGPG